MNVIGSRPDGWWRDRDAAMVALVRELEGFAARTGDEVVVVFERQPRPRLTSTVVEVAAAPRPGRDAADMEIARRVAADDDPGSITVATSDRWLADQVGIHGCAVMGAATFRSQI